MAKITVFEERSIPFVYSDVFGAYVSEGAFESWQLTVGERYTIRWNGEEYTRTAFDAGDFTTGAVGLGNAGFIGGDPDPEGLTFVMGYSSIDGGMIFFSAEAVDAVTVSVTLEIGEKAVMPAAVMGGFDLEESGIYGAGAEGKLLELKEGTVYKVVLDGLVYSLTAAAMEEGQPEGVYIGDSALIAGQAGSDVPFIAAVFLNGGAWYTVFATTLAGEEHLIGVYEDSSGNTLYRVTAASLKAVGDAIRAKGGTNGPLTFPEGMVAAINGIVSGSGSTDDVCYVTFMNGDQVLYVKPVARGDDCVDVYARGWIETPVKESTIDTDYTYIGWSLQEGGVVASTALLAVMEDRTIYAAYAGSVRHYTVTYYDDDGVTVLKTESLAYGSTPTYKAQKTGFVLDHWEPALATVTGDAAYTAAWTTKITFAGATWEDIARISAAGTASQHFALGDTRTININGSTADIFIAGFDHDDKSDGSGKAGITVLTKHIIPNLKIAPKYATGNTTTTFDASTIDSAASGLYSTLDADLKAVIKRVYKKYDTGRNCILAESGVTTMGRYIWVPSVQETGKTITSDMKAWINTLGTKYSYIPTYLGTTPAYPNNSNRYWARNLAYQNKNYTRNVYYDSSYGYTYDGSTNGQEQNLIVGFCI